MLVTQRIIDCFSPQLPKYARLQDQSHAQCVKDEYKGVRRSSVHDIRSLLLGFFAGIIITFILAGVMIQRYLSQLELQFRAGHYPADAVFGKVKTIEVTFEPETAFVESDPLKGRWDGSLAVLNGQRRTPWDDLYLSPWIEIPDPIAAGANDGVPLKQFSDDPSWSKTSQGFIPSILHQLHCVGIMKHATMRFESGDFSEAPFEDMTHCLEYLRQTLMCHGDLTLERPLFVSNESFGGPTGWGITHQCRDWSAIHAFFSKHTITFSNGKPILWIEE